MEYLCYLYLCLHIFLNENEKIILTLIGVYLYLFHETATKFGRRTQSLLFGSTQTHGQAASHVLNKSL